MEMEHVYNATRASWCVLDPGTGLELTGLIFQIR